MECDVEKERRQFKKYTYRGVPLNELVKMSLMKFSELLTSSKRRRLRRGISERELDLLKKCAHSRKNAEGTEEKPEMVKTQARTMIVVPHMLGCVIGVHNGRTYVPVEIKPEMLGYRLKDFSETKTCSTHGKPGVGATSGSKFVPLK